MPKSALLIATLGATDIHFVGKDGGKFVNIGPSKDQLKKLHSFLLTKLEEYKIEFWDGDILEERKKVAAALSLDKSSIDLDCKDGSVELFKSGDKIVIYPTLLYPVIKEIEKENLTLHSVLLLGTSRSGDKWKGEPIAAGPLLKKWLDVLIKVNNIKGDAINFNFLAGDQELGKDPQTDLNILQGIDNAIKETSSRTDGADLIVLSHTGGMPQVTALVEDSVLLRFAKKKIYICRKTEASSKAQLISFNIKARFAAPAISLNARERAVKLIEKGDFIGAYAAVEGVSNAKWATSCGILSDYCKTGRLPREEIAFYIKNIEYKKQLGSPYVAFLIKSNWDQGKVLETLSYITTFFDTALIDLMRTDERTLEGSVMPLQRTFNFKDALPSENELPRKDYKTDNPNYCIEVKRENTRLAAYRLIKKNLKTWLKYFQAKNIKTPPLVKKLDDKLSEIVAINKDGLTNSLYEIRNITQHAAGSINQQVIDNIGAVIRKQVFGGSDDPLSSNSLIEQIVDSIEPGKTPFYKIYDELKNGLIKDILDGEF